MCKKCAFQSKNKTPEVRNSNPNIFHLIRWQQNPAEKLDAILKGQLPSRNITHPTTYLDIICSHERFKSVCDIFDARNSFDRGWGLQKAVFRYLGFPKKTPSINGAENLGYTYVSQKHKMFGMLSYHIQDIGQVVFPISIQKLSLPCQATSFRFLKS